MGTRRLLATVPTAFHDDGSLDLDAQTALAASYIAAGCSMLVALEFSGGEPETLDPDERDRVVRAIRHGAGGAPVLVGVGAATTDAVVRGHRAGPAGASGLVVTVPVVSGRVADLLAEIAATGLPLWLHQPPQPGGGPETATLLDVAAELGLDHLIVESAPTPDSVAELTAGGLKAYGGLAGLFLPEELEAGAMGTIAASAVPERVAEVLSDVPDEGPVPLDAYLAVLPYLRLEAGSPGSTIRKEAWRQRGILHSGRTRHGRPLGASTKRAVTRRLRAVGISPQDAYPGA